MVAKEDAVVAAAVSEVVAVAAAVSEADVVAVAAATKTRARPRR